MVPRHALRVLSAGLRGGPLAICDVAGELQQHGFAIAFATPLVFADLGSESAGVPIHHQIRAGGYFVGVTRDR